PLPGVTRYEDVQLAEPESGRVLLSAERIDCEAKLGNAPLQVTLVAPSLDLDRFDALWKVTQRLLLRELCDDAKNVQLRMESLELRSASEVQRVAEIKAELATTTKGRWIQATFRRSEASPSTGQLPEGKLLLVRNTVAARSECEFV